MTDSGDRGLDLHDLSDPHDRAVMNSSLWAAAGDALGWITELTDGTRGVERRTGLNRVTEPVAWKRAIGGRIGPTVRFPPGTYSDDTQLRLAVSRAIRGDGSFDVEAFAKVELSVWPTYALGAGLGSRAAAANLSKRRANWFSNFFESGNTKYLDSGGNGAAMRIHPHVWSTSQSDDRMLLDVLRDSIVTHGHPQGFCGAIFHALCLNGAIAKGDIPTFSDWTGYIDRFRDISRLVEEDAALATFWKPAWEQSIGGTLKDATHKFRDEALREVETVEDVLDSSDLGSFHRVLSDTGCLKSNFRGSGFKTALAAAALVQFHGRYEIEKCLECAANELSSDTDTIASMAGSMFGAASSHTPQWPIQDRSYIAQEALRLSAIARGQHQDSFEYPDLVHWNPPAKQNVPIGLAGDSLALAGLGKITPVGEQYRVHRFVWQWYALTFGQTVLAKRRADTQSRIAPTQLPGPGHRARLDDHAADKDGERPHQAVLPLGEPRSTSVSPGDDTSVPAKPTGSSGSTIDSWSDQVIASGFDDRTLGRLLNRCIDESQSVESSIGFVAIVAKAKIARQKRSA